MDVSGALSAADVAEHGQDFYRADLAPPEAKAAAPAGAAAPARFGAGAGGGVNWPAIGIIAGLHAALLAALVTMDVVSLKLPVSEPILMDLVPAAAPPPPPAPMPQPRLEPITPIVAPPVLDILPPRPSPVQAVAEPAPVSFAPAVAARPAPSPVPAASGIGEIMPDLSATMVSAEPPQYPRESRRRKEEGMVALMVTVGTDGRVADIEVFKSSGFHRLDRAALAAVRKWRWSPTVRDGAPVPVRGLVEIPFVLKK
ncbi:energy transducer TonB [Pedomonas mirosovicensis]|uniref:energy transducer TonB n=1 Tax=Pedomonas mirosovicensis TaxID=2908641 RepID=UPI002166F822|nr:energy transducer TonB [Pedomonas mirosovicensis]MCH8685151.1 energy transducer TonB [Pedomonas mirosovicensis]